MTAPSDVFVLLEAWQQATAPTTGEASTVPDGRSRLTYEHQSAAEHLSRQVELTPAQLNRLAASLTRDISRAHAERLTAALKAVIDEAQRLLPDPYGDQELDAEHLPMITVYDLDGRDAPDATGTCIWSHTFFEPIAAAVDSRLRFQLRGRFLSPKNTCWCDDCDNDTISGFCALASLLNSSILARPLAGKPARIGMSVLLPPCHEPAPMWIFTDDTAQFLTRLLTNR